MTYMNQSVTLSCWYCLHLPFLYQKIYSSSCMRYLFLILMRVCLIGIYTKYSNLYLETKEETLSLELFVLIENICLTSFSYKKYAFCNFFSSDNFTVNQKMLTDHHFREKQLSIQILLL